MNQMRGHMQAKEMEQFQKAYQEKLQKLPVEERAKYMGKPENITPRSGQNANGQGLDGRQRLKDGSGMGQGRSGSTRDGSIGGR